jgi:vitamin B12 transporter
VLFLPALLQAQGEDTLRRVRAPEVLVEEDRSEREYAIPAVAVTSDRTDKLTIQSGSTRASDFIRLLSPSLALRSYGTLGGITLSSYRGLPPEYTIIFRDGIRLTNEQNSLTDLGRITSASLTRVDLLSSNSSILLGGDAVAASLNLVSYLPTSTLIAVGTRLTSNDQLRSVGEREGYATLSYGKDQWGVGGSYNRQSSRGDFPYTDRFSKQEVRRENNDATLNDLVLSGTFEAEDLQLASTFSYVAAERGAPGGAVIEGRGASQFRARQTDEDSYLSLRAKTKLEGWTVSPAVAFQSQAEQYVDPDVLDMNTGGTLNDSYLNRLYFAEAKTDGSITEDVHSYFGVQLQENHLFSNENTDGSDTTIARTRFGSYAAISLRPVPALTLNLAGRAEWISDLNIWKGLPQIHIQYLVGALDLTINANYGKSFHAPTFNQLYWRRYGNPDLRHEQGDNLELGLLWSPGLLDGGKTTFRVTGFRAEIRDQILWLPQSNGDYSPINIQNARTQGIEARGILQMPIDDDLLIDLDAAYTLLDAENLTEGNVKGKRLPYSATTQSVLRIQVTSIAAGSLSFVNDYRGKRYSNVSNDPLSRLDPYSTMTVNYTAPSIQLLKNTQLQLNLAALNLLNAHYTEIANYPMAGITVRLGAELRFSPTLDN